MHANKWEVGSDFHLTNDVVKDSIPWPENSIFLSNGRMPILALKSIIDLEELSCPDFFCSDVISFWNENGVKTTLYKVYFSDGQLKVDYSTVPKTGAVLAVNFFGIDAQDEWDSFKLENNIILIEDHTHSPVSKWAVNSTADYAFSSLRKTLAVPDGSVFWSPAKHSLGLTLDEAYDPKIKLEAMSLKKDYFLGVYDNKEEFLNLYSIGEQDLSGSQLKCISQYSFKKISDGYPLIYLEKRKKNIISFLEGLSLRALKNFELIKVLPENVPFGAVIVCSSLNDRNKLRSFLILNNVYCPVHWHLDKALVVYNESLDLSERVLTIPIDQRYSREDMLKVAELVNRFFDNETF